MSRLPAISAAEAISAFERAGFVYVRSASSHRILKKEGHRFLLSVPEHGAKCLKPGTLRSLIRASGMTVDEFCSLLK